MLTKKAEALRALHVPGDPLVLPNAWDASSATVLADEGFPAVATSSGAVADSLGFSDGEATPPDEMFAAVRRIAGAVEVPVTADIERGYGLEPKEIVQRLTDAGAVGCNLEDSDPATHALIDIDEHADWLSQVRAAADEAGVPIVINARIDVHLRAWGEPGGRLPEAIERGRRYLAAGADCVYPIFLNEHSELSRFVHEVAGPVNVVFLPKGSLHELKTLGVARISFGSGLNQAGQALLSRLAKKIARGESPY